MTILFYLMEAGRPGTLLLFFLKQQRREVRQIIAPHHPRVHARRFDGRQRNVLRPKPCDEFAVRRYEIIFLSASNPEQVQTGTLSTQRRKLIFFTVSHRSEEHTSELQSRLHLVCRL